MRFRMNIEDLRMICRYLGTLILLLAAAMVVPLLVACLFSEWHSAVDFLYGIGAALVVGNLLRLVHIHPSHLTAQQAIVVTGLSWIAMSFIGAIPLYLSGHFVGFLDALFEAVSGFTTTGLTLIQDVDHMSYSMNMWRFTTQLIGGQGILIAAIAIGLFSPYTGGQGMAIYASEGRGEQILPSIRATARFIWTTSAVIIALGLVVSFIATLAAGVAPVRAFLDSLFFSISAFDTGGFAPQSLGVSHYHSWFLEITVTIIGLLGTLNFTLYADLARGHLREILKNIETRTFFIWTSVVFIVGMIAIVTADPASNLATMLRRDLFTFLSAATNTGFSVLQPAQMSALMASGALFAVLLAMTVGGSSGSTSGGIKTMRIGIILKSVMHSLKSMLLPDSAVSNTRFHHINQRVLSPAMTSAALTITLFYIMSYVVGAVAGIALGYDSIPAMFESISAASNTGLSAGVLTVGTPAVLKIIYIIQMITGRLEFITIFAIIYALGSSLIFARWGKGRRKHAA